MATRGWEHATPNDVRDRRVPKLPTKYHAEATIVDGIRFDSKREAARYGELTCLAKAGEIRDLRLQPVFPLAAWTEGRTARGGEVIGQYVADFSYVTNRGVLVVEDVKGMKTLPLARWKQKHLLAQYGITVKEVR